MVLVIVVTWLASDHDSEFSGKLCFIKSSKLNFNLIPVQYVPALLDSRVLTIVIQRYVRYLMLAPFYAACRLEGLKYKSSHLTVTAHDRVVAIRQEHQRFHKDTDVNYRCIVVREQNFRFGSGASARIYYNNDDLHGTHRLRIHMTVYR